MTLAPNSAPLLDSKEAELLKLLGGDQALVDRLTRIRHFARKVRVSEYHITNSCNIRCQGCWFFQHDFDLRTRDQSDLGVLRQFIQEERGRGVNAALLIGGEPTLFPDRVAAFAAGMEYVSISTNGLRKLPMEGFENVAVLITLFGGGPLDDQLRAIKPGGQRFTGLLDTTLKHYYRDPRAFFIYAITEDGTGYIEDTVKRIRDNGNRVNFNFYSKYHTSDPLRSENAQRLMEEALRVKQLYPETVMSHPYYIQTLVTGKSHWGQFGYDVCPSISVDHPAHKERLANGNRVLPKFNAWAPDLKTINFCCTSGHCSDCRDSQAVFSWLMVSMDRFLDSPERLETWLQVAESYWSQFCWVPFLRDSRYDGRTFRVDAPPPSAPRLGTTPS